MVQEIDPSWRRATESLLSDSDSSISSLKRKRVTHVCEKPGPTGLLGCRFVTSAHSLWRMFTQDTVNVVTRNRREEPASGRVTLTVTCRECGKQASMSVVSWSVSGFALLSRSLERGAVDGTSTIWRLEVTNRASHGGASRRA